MKKIISKSLAVAAAFVLFGCGENSSVSDANIEYDQYNVFTAVPPKVETKDYVVHHGKLSDLYILKSDKVPIIIHPGEFILADVYEYVKLPNNIAAQIHGRSSIARLGLLVHTSAGWVDPGYAGHLTLELINVNKIPIKIYPLTKVAQLVFFETEEVETPYHMRKSSKYVEEEGATFSRISQDFKI